MNIYDLNLTDLENYFEKNNEKKYRASQVFSWLYEKRVKSFSDMTNLNKDIISKLESISKVYL